MNHAVYCTVFAILYIHIRACFPGDFRCANCLQLVLVLVLVVDTAGSVPLSTLVVGAEASYASTPRGGRLSGQAAKLGTVGGGGRGKTETGFVLSRVGNLNTVLNIHASMYSRE